MTLFSENFGCSVPTWCWVSLVILKLGVILLINFLARALWSPWNLEGSQISWNKINSPMYTHIYTQYLWKDVKTWCYRLSLERKIERLQKQIMKQTYVIMLLSYFFWVYHKRVYKNWIKYIFLKTFKSKCKHNFNQQIYF